MVTATQSAETRLRVVSVGLGSPKRNHATGADHREVRDVPHVVAPREASAVSARTVQLITVDCDTGDITVSRPFQADWVCDSSALPGRHYRIRNLHNGWFDYPWWRVVTGDDDDRVRDLKMRCAQKVSELCVAAYSARQAAEQAVLYGTIPDDVVQRLQAA